MLKSRSPMKRGGLKRQDWQPAPKPVYRPLAATPNYAQVSATTPAAPEEKERPVRSEDYRRAVASLPCIHCKIAGISQCAHANTGKGAGIKASDLDSFPLCACQPGRRGCHSQFDQGALFTKLERRLIEAAWIADTRRKIKMMGLWPKELDTDD